MLHDNKNENPDSAQSSCKNPLLYTVLFSVQSQYNTGTVPTATYTAPRYAALLCHSHPRIKISEAGTDLLPHIVSSAPASEGSVPEISHCSKKQFLFYLSFYFISFNTFHNGSTLFPLSPSLSHDDPSPDIHPHKVSVYLHHNGMPTGSLRLPLPALKKAFAYPPHPARPIH